MIYRNFASIFFILFFLFSSAGIGCGSHGSDSDLNPNNGPQPVLDPSPWAVFKRISEQELPHPQTPYPSRFSLVRLSTEKNHAKEMTRQAAVYAVDAPADAPGHFQTLRSEEIDQRVQALLTQPNFVSVYKMFKEMQPVHRLDTRKFMGVFRYGKLLSLVDYQRYFTKFTHLRAIDSEWVEVVARYFEFKNHRKISYEALISAALTLLLSPDRSVATDAIRDTWDISAGDCTIQIDLNPAALTTVLALRGGKIEPGSLILAPVDCQGDRAGPLASVQAYLDGLAVDPSENGDVNEATALIRDLSGYSERAPRPIANANDVTFGTDRTVFAVHGIHRSDQYGTEAITLKLDFNDPRTYFTPVAAVRFNNQNEGNACSRPWAERTGPKDGVIRGVDIESLDRSKVWTVENLETIALWLATEMVARVVYNDGKSPLRDYRTLTAAEVRRFMERESVDWIKNHHLPEVHLPSVSYEQINSAFIHKRRFEASGLFRWEDVISSLFNTSPSNGGGGAHLWSDFDRSRGWDANALSRMIEAFSAP